MMRKRTPLALFAAAPLALGLAACNPEPATDPAPDVEASADASANDSMILAPGTAPRKAGAWQTVSSGEGGGLFYEVGEGESGRVHLFCPSGGGLLINVRAFRPVGSEERMTFGSGGTVVTLVADPAGDDLRGGVSGEGPVPENLRALLTGVEGVAINYGSQNIGPLPQVPDKTARDFATGCTD